MAVVPGRQAPGFGFCDFTILVSCPCAGVNDPVNPAAVQAVRASWTVLPLSDGTARQRGVGFAVGFGAAVGLGVGLGVGMGVGVAFGDGVGVRVGAGFGAGVDVVPPSFPPAAVGNGLAGPDGAVVAPAEPPAVPFGLPKGEGPTDRPARSDGTKTAPSTPPVVRIPLPRVTASTTATMTSAAPAIDRRASIRRRTEATRTRGVTTRTTGRANGNAQAGQASTASAQHQRHE